MLIPTEIEAVWYPNSCYVLYQSTNDSIRDLTEPIQSKNQLNFF